MTMSEKAPFLLHLQLAAISREKSYEDIYPEYGPMRIPIGGSVEEIMTIACTNVAWECAKAELGEDDLDAVCRRAKELLASLNT